MNVSIVSPPVLATLVLPPWCPAGRATAESSFAFSLPHKFPLLLSLWGFWGVFQLDQPGKLLLELLQAQAVPLQIPGTCPQPVRSTQPSPA